AEVTLVEYGDYECLHCRNAHAVVKQIQRYLGSEHLRHVFRHFPLTQARADAERAAQAAEAAGSRGRFWEAHDLLFERRGTYEQIFRRYAAALGVDARLLLGEVAEGVYLARVREDFMSGVMSGVKGTPTFFINGAPYEGGYDFDTLLSAVEEAGESVLLC
ncbi:MAG TPA: thioredoxin domain-containing protein, partial [Pyrinomonadaceae bacterium]|nr:thioredoxin domain-containing protein [Pyrinomonadaceae bacterium]